MTFVLVDIALELAESTVVVSIKIIQKLYIQQILLEIQPIEEANKLRFLSITLNSNCSHCFESNKIITISFPINFEISISPSVFTFCIFANQCV